MLEKIRSYCLQKMYVKESFPFDENTLVFKFDHENIELFRHKKDSVKYHLGEVYHGKSYIFDVNGPFI